jgi:DivIVA domain-containing protein
MTGSMAGNDNGRLTISDLQRVHFEETKGFGRGYDETEVDAFVSRCASEMQRLADRIKELEAQARRTPAAALTNEEVVQESVRILTSAQQTADATVRNAEDYSARVMSEAQAMYEDARRKSSTMLEDAHRSASQAVTEATEQHDEIERQTLYLRALRDSTQVQVQTFLAGLLDHVTNEYGRALPAAVEAVRPRGRIPAAVTPLELPEAPADEPLSG